MEGLQCLKHLLSGSLQKSFANPSCKMSYRISAPWNTRKDNRLDDYSSSFPLYHFIHAVNEHFTEHSFVLGAVLGPGA